MQFSSLAWLQYFHGGRAYFYKRNPVDDGDRGFVSSSVDWYRLDLSCILTLPECERRNVHSAAHSHETTKKSSTLLNNLDYHTIRSQTFSPSFPHPENACLKWPPPHRHLMQSTRVVQRHEYGFGGE